MIYLNSGLLITTNVNNLPQNKENFLGFHGSSTYLHFFSSFFLQCYSEYYFSRFILVLLWYADKLPGVSLSPESKDGGDEFIKIGE